MCFSSAEMDLHLLRDTDGQTSESFSLDREQRSRASCLVTEEQSSDGTVSTQSHVVTDVFPLRSMLIFGGLSLGLWRGSSL